ncbi:OmpA family protein [Magnetococcales bacterium HHB-1]
MPKFRMKHALGVGLAILLAGGSLANASSHGSHKNTYEPAGIKGWKGPNNGHPFIYEPGYTGFGYYTDSWDGDADKDGVKDSKDKCPGTPQGVTVDAKGCPVDSDGDGVPDYLDKCPGTPAGVSVDTKGCPIDSDGDGIPDYLDKCPGTPPGTDVDSKGCPVDLDGDGVLNANDLCPATPAGVKVDERGCWVLKGVNFDSGRSTLRYSSRKVLNEVAAFLKRNDAVKIEIQGHTDSIGAADYNQRLSERRANTVRSYLIRKGVAADRLTAKGYGLNVPAADNSTAQGRAINRRVEMKTMQ